MIQLADSEGTDQTAWMRRLIWAFAIRIYPKTRFHMAQARLYVGFTRYKKNQENNQIPQK